MCSRESQLVVVIKVRRRCKHIKCPVVNQRAPSNVHITHDEEKMGVAHALHFEGHPSMFDHLQFRRVLASLLMLLCVCACKFQVQDITYRLCK